MSNSSIGLGRLGVLVASGAGLLAAGLVAIAPEAGAADPPVKPAASGQQPTIVGLGDSYMSGEGAMLANRNCWQSSFSDCWAFIPSDKYWSSWQTGAGALGGTISAPNVTNNQPANTWRSVYGDANDYPNTGGKESIPYCDRSYSAPMHIERAWASVNLACSGATQTTVPKNSNDSFKPGIDFFDKANPAPYVAEGKGQALMLQDLASTNENIRVVTLSIGGNDMGFADIATECITEYLNPLGTNRCETKDSVQKMVTGGLPKARAGVKKAINNVADAMNDAGYGPDEWKLVYQIPPLPVTDGAGNAYPEKGTFQANSRTQQGCPLYNSTLDWIAGPVTQAENNTHGVYQRLAGAMLDGVRDARTDLDGVQITVLQTTDTFDNHKLCDKNAKVYAPYAKNQAGKNPVWGPKNGQDTEWINPVNAYDQALGGNIYQKSMPLHPDYWGQRALADCIDKAVTTTSGAVAVPCRQDGNGWDATEHRPNMKLATPDTLWVVAVGLPLVKGVPNPGQTLTADVTGDFTPKGGALTYTYQWLRSGQEIPGATGDKYTLTSQDVAESISFKVTASLPGVPSATATSNDVKVSDLVVNELPKVTGTPTVGAPLTLQQGSYTPAPGSIKQQWLLDGRPIPGATGTTYTPVGTDKGKQISAEVDVEAAPFPPLTIGTEEVGPVGEGVMTVTGKPTIAGQAKGGETLTADTAGVTFTPTPDSVSFQWYRNGEPIPHADGRTYEVGDGDQGTQITVRAHGHSEGYSDVVSDASDPTSVVQQGTITVLADPTLKYYNAGLQSLSKIPNGTARYGRTLEPDLVGVFSEWPNDPDVAWYRQAKGSAAKQIKGASGIAYELSRKDIGKSVYAVITTTNPGFVEATARTQSVKVTYGKRKVLRAPTITSSAKAQSVRAKVGVPLVTSRAVFVPAAKARYQWMRAGTPIKGATDRKYVPTPKDAGKKLRVKAYVPEGKGFLTAQVLSKPTKPVKAVRGLG